MFTGDLQRATTAVDVSSAQLDLLTRVRRVLPTPADLLEYLSSAGLREHARRAARDAHLLAGLCDVAPQNVSHAELELLQYVARNARVVERLRSLVMTRTLGQVRSAVARQLTRICRSNTDHPSLDTACAKEGATRRTEFAHVPAGVDPIEHGGHERPLQVTAGTQPAGFQEGTVHVPDGVPARLAGRFQRVENIAADHSRP